MSSQMERSRQLELILSNRVVRLTFDGGILWYDADFQVDPLGSIEEKDGVFFLKQLHMSIILRLRRSKPAEWYSELRKKFSSEALKKEDTYDPIEGWRCYRNHHNRDYIEWRTVNTSVYIKIVCGDIVLILKGQVQALSELHSDEWVIAIAPEYIKRS